MSKRLFEILDGMNFDDIKNGTRLVSVSPTFISADKVQQGAKVTMGSDEQSLYDLMNEKVIPILILVDKDEYVKRREDSENNNHE